MDLKARCTMDIDDYWEQYADNLHVGSRGNHIHIDNGGDILAVAHLDFVGANHFAVAELGLYGNVAFSPSLDDRLGAHIILDILPEIGVVCDVLLTDGEESSRSTAADFNARKKYLWMFSFDRRGSDAVMYQYSSKETRDAVKSAGFTLGHGTYSDISSMSHMGCAGFNFGTGYHQEHTRMCHAVLGEVFEQVDKFVRFWNVNHSKSFRGEYTRTHYGGNYSGYYGNLHGHGDAYSQSYRRVGNRLEKVGLTRVEGTQAANDPQAAYPLVKKSDSAQYMSDTQHVIDCEWCGTSIDARDIRYYEKCLLCPNCREAVDEYVLT